MLKSYRGGVCERGGGGCSLLSGCLFSFCQRLFGEPGQLPDAYRIGQFAIVIVNLLAFYAFWLYDLPQINRTQNLLSNSLLAVVVSGVLVVFIFFLPRLVLEQFSRRALLCESVFLLVYLYLSRKVASNLIKRSPVSFFAIGCKVDCVEDCSVKAVSNYNSPATEMKSALPVAVIFPPAQPELGNTEIAERRFDNHECS